MDKKKTIIYAGILLILVLGAVISLQFLNNNKTSTDRDEKQDNSKTDETATVPVLKIDEWGIGVSYNASIKTVTYKIETGETFAVRDGSLSIISIVTQEGVEYKYDLALPAGSTTSVTDAICTNLGIGRDKRGSVTSPESGIELTEVAHIGEYYYYNLTRQGGARCGMSEGAQKAFDSVEKMLIDGIKAS